jgi:hypothetical protein
MFHCERCGRQAGLLMLDCPERQLGSCMYTVQRNRVNSLVGYTLLAAGIASAFIDFFVLALLLLKSTSPLPLTGWLVMAAIMLVVSAAILAFGVYSVIGEQVSLYNAETGQMWQRQGLDRLEIRRLIINQIEPLPLDAYLNLTCNWPASLSALLVQTPAVTGLDIAASNPGINAMISAIARNPAAYLVEAALLGLLADRRISLCRAYVQTSYFGRPPRQVVEYLVKPGEVSWQGAEGWLEQRILYAVTSWSQYKEARDWPQGTPIKALVRAIYPRDQSSPGSWLINQVLDDAVKRNLGTIAGMLRHRLEPNPDLAGRLAGEARNVKEVYYQLGRVFPEFIRDLDAKIRQGISSREENSG